MSNCTSYLTTNIYLMLGEQCTVGLVYLLENLGLFGPKFT